MRICATSTPTPASATALKRAMKTSTSSRTTRPAFAFSNGRRGMGCRGVLNGRESTTVSIWRTVTSQEKTKTGATRTTQQQQRKHHHQTTTTTSTTTVVEDIDGEKLEIKSSVTALGVMTALCTLGGCAMLFNPSEALASTATSWSWPSRTRTL